MIGQPVPKYAIDTNVYIESFRRPAAAVALKNFLRVSFPKTFLSAVVMQELRVGARTAARAAALQAGVFDPFERRGRAFAPSVAAYKDCGRILVDLIQREGLELAETKRALVNDVLLAASCRERGVTLITTDHDFDLIARYLKGLRRVAPWP